MTDAPKPFEIEWYECRADEDDVAYSKTKVAQLAGAKRVKTGDVMWRAIRGIGPLAPDHDHWAKWHIGIGDEEEKAALMMAASPVLVYTLKQVLSRTSMSNLLREEVEAAIKLAETGEAV